MTLNAVIALILRFFSPNSIDFQDDYITVIEDRPIGLISVNIVSQFHSSTFGENYNAPCSAVSLRQLSILSFQLADAELHRLHTGDV